MDITVVRDGNDQTFSIQVERAEDPAILETARPAVNLGIQVQELSPEAARHWGYTDLREGIIITRVLPESPAAEAGLQPGDVIVEIGHRTIKTLQEYHALLKEASVEAGVLLLIYRGKNSLYVALRGKQN